MASRELKTIIFTKIASRTNKKRHSWVKPQPRTYHALKCAVKFHLNSQKPYLEREFNISNFGQEENEPL